MKAGLFTGIQRFEICDVPDAQLVAAACVVDITLCGICGSDVSAYRYGNEMGTEYPKALCGHEWTGVVRDVADGVASLTTGDRVILGSPPPCGTHCSACGQGRFHACDNVATAMLGGDGFSPHSGGFAPSQTVDARRLVRIPDGISDMQAAMAEPATVAAHGVRRSGLIPGERVAVLGAGPIGLFAVQLAKAAGAGHVMVIEPDAQRRALALQLGADVACPPGTEAQDAVFDVTGGLGLDRVYDCAGGRTTLQDAVTLLRRGGSVMLIGFATSATSIESGMWLLKEISVRTSFAFDREDTQTVLGMMASGALDVAPLYSETVSLDGAIGAFADLAAGSGQVKILVDPRV